MTNPQIKPRALKIVEALRRVFEFKEPTFTEDMLVQHVEKLLDSAIAEYATQELARAEAEAAHAMALYDLSCCLVTASSAEELVDVIMTYLEPLGAMVCVLLRFDTKEGDSAKIMASWPPKNPFAATLETSAVKSYVFAPILLSPSVLVIDNTITEPSLDEETRVALLDLYVGSLMSAPLLLHAELVGRLVVGWSSERKVNPHDARMLHAVATQCTAVAERLFLVERYQREIQERATLEGVLLEAQQALLRELGTPIIPLADDILLMPLIGTIDEVRAQRITEVMLSGIVSRGAATAILDLSGVPTVTAQIADALLGVTRAVRLVGAEVVITGMRPDMAKTLVEGGATLEGFMVRSTVQSGIAFALAKSNAHRRSSSRSV